VPGFCHPADQGVKFNKNTDASRPLLARELPVVCQEAWEKSALAVFAINTLQLLEMS